MDFTPVEDAGLETTYHLTSLNSFSDVLSSLNINASGALDMSSFLKASAKLGFANKIKTTKTHEKYLYTANIQRGILYTAPQQSFKRGANHPLQGNSKSDDKRKISKVTFRKELPSTELDFATHCGHGFVSGIATGVQLNATIDTSTADSDTASKFSGSLKLKALAGLITASGSIEGKSEEQNSLKKSAVNTYILGGERYLLPRNIDELSEFVRKLTNLVDKHPRPVKIAITHYSALSATGEKGDISVFEDASRLRPLIYAYFAIREARHRIADVLEVLHTPGENELFVIPDKLMLFQKIHELTLLMRETQETLRLCRRKLAEQNIETAKDVQKGMQKKSIQQIYQNLENKAREKANFKFDVFLNPTIAQKVQQEGTDSFSCADSEKTKRIQTIALRNYFFSLVAMPISLSNIEDFLVSQNKDAVSLLLKNSKNNVLLKRNQLKTQILEKRKTCAAKHQDRINELRKRTRDPITGERATVHLELAISRRNRECKKHVEEDEKILAKLNEDLKKIEKISNPLKLVKKVLSREIYQKRFYPLLKSMCEIDSQYAICSYTYEKVMKEILEHIKLGKSKLEEMAQILKIPYPLGSKENEKLQNPAGRRLRGPKGGLLCNGREMSRSHISCP